MLGFGALAEVALAEIPGQPTGYATLAIAGFFVPVNGNASDDIPVIGSTVTKSNEN